MEINVVILAAGMGKRMQHHENKQFIQLAGYPILYHTLMIFQKMKAIHNILLVVREDEMSYVEKNILTLNDFSKVIKMVKGGKERVDSVYNALRSIKGEGLVLIHDGARPFVKEKDILRLIQMTLECNAAVLGVPVKDTIKSVDTNHRVIKTPDRSLLWAVQTPQAFELNLIKQAYERRHAHSMDFWDDAMLVEELMNHEVKMVEGSYDNIKITTPSDLAYGEWIAKNLTNT
ncbi:2-C-methyl-D-erythritol 4-phosphate cytidylyltransferase [Petrocella sp. FN5]|uniref:2-C-methyl-D-erythritol 4-phosphate cytidylyltransferase n=1 Tax=Petrocella sp. FN5 TaxID=3032002 RepID=UPI0023DA3011|nr:2-C-methyl-D-erythritol 4-phosphate cytidylyltransferase [Petrocella sp. FN5]MDF1615986.1 2-C-methyl-D-erythritol 4-phosphate cytidylyltransferase [Petrocella sp. FN5]